jgi:hypothetical protein
MNVISKKQSNQGGEIVLRSKRFRKNWILILIISSIPGLIFGGVIYWLAGARLENELLQMHNKQIQQRAANIDEQFSYVETLVIHWAFDPKFNYSLAGISLSRDFEIVRDITKTLNIMQGSNRLAKETELYLEGTSPVRFHPDYEALKDTAQIEKSFISRNGAVIELLSGLEREDP